MDAENEELIAFNIEEYGLAMPTLPAMYDEEQESVDRLMVALINTLRTKLEMAEGEPLTVSDASKVVTAVDCFVHEKMCRRQFIDEFSKMVGAARIELSRAVREAATKRATAIRQLGISDKDLEKDESGW